MPPRSGAGGFPISVSGIRGHRMGDAGKKKAARRTNEWHVRHCFLPIDLLRICPEGKLQKMAASIKRDANRKGKVGCISLLPINQENCPM